ncbi:MAG: GIY-YIG nuclease family protein [Candidatus Neomarinimicrobiota bacterium]
MKNKYYVYIGQLSKYFAISPKAKLKNIHPDPNRVGLYVGYSIKTPEKRWKQHLTKARNSRGRLFSKIAAKWGEPYLHWKKFRKFNPVHSIKEAKRLEKKLAEKYRDKGYATWSDALPYRDKN